ncbi:LppW family protein [Geodermatophilus sp. TF02-6]|uniref:serine hydrolase n=1 Tax=Geodermatophilus sp. TF02-6 TaxID=2250575 RepID=UPI000DE82D1D|nr:serine hydrolase [Geodermatophilus sp. TF02-6]RBY78751.1 LppW family protein [Geodermatophilus sp. TF02-6]
MPRGPSRRAQPRRARRVGLLPALLVLLGVLVVPGRAGADGRPAAEIVPAVTAAYGPTGTFAVVVARQQTRAEGRSLRAAEARSARVEAASADNGLADRPFATASLAKLFVAEDVLHRARTGAVALEPADLAWLQEMIRSSGDLAASLLWERFDGDRMVRDVAARYGLTGTAPPRISGQWGETTTTARDLARFLTRLPLVAHPADAATLLEWMRSATPTAADGFDQRFGILGTAPGRPAVKQAWMCCVAGAKHLHSTGLVGSRVVVLLSEVPQSVSWDAARTALSAAAAAVPPPHEPC